MSGIIGKNIEIKRDEDGTPMIVGDFFLSKNSKNAFTSILRERERQNMSTLINELEDIFDDLTYMPFTTTYIYYNEEEEEDDKNRDSEQQEDI